MSTALWCVFFAGLLPYFTVIVAKRSGGGYDNSQPREWAKGLSGFRQRAYAAHQNHFEFFPFFAAAVIIAEMKTGGSAGVDRLALATIACRLFYTACYFNDKAALRSLAWGLALLGIIGLFVIAAMGK
ncbi:MAG: hypothetical protein CFE31_17385 [Rhizobiales bacterium PAR1]|nr:MAG: hypothetical protein CFE31_17385 [Rhizobiales bacterium PAR1]